MILYEWNALSLREMQCLHRLLAEIAAFFTTVVDELRGLYASVTRRVKEAVDASLFFQPALLGPDGQVRIDVQDAERRMARAQRPDQPVGRRVVAADQPHGLARIEPWRAACV